MRAIEKPLRLLANVSKRFNDQLALYIRHTRLICMRFLLHCVETTRVNLLPAMKKQKTHISSKDTIISDFEQNANCNPSNNHSFHTNCFRSCSICTVETFSEHVWRAADMLPPRANIILQYIKTILVPCATNSVAQIFIWISLTDKINNV